MKVFVSYAHQQEDWVRHALVPVLTASGSEVLVDWERFRAGHAVIGQMDDLQDQAERHLLVITDAYLASAHCRHEMERALALDPGFTAGRAIPIRRDDAPLPDAIKNPDPLYVDLRTHDAAEPWRLLIEQAGGALHMEAPAWLAALDQAKRHLERRECVNLLVHGDVDWRAWLRQLCETRFSRLGMVDLNNPAAVSRNGLIGEMLRVTNRSREIPAPPDDLPEMAKAFVDGGRSCVALLNFHRVADRPHYGNDLFGSLRYMVMDVGQLVLLAHTHQPVATLLPRENEVSKIDFKTVELGGHAAR